MTVDDLVGHTVTLLSEDDLGDTNSVVSLCVTVKQDNNIRVLSDSMRLTDVIKGRHDVLTVIVSALLPVQLSQRHNRNAKSTSHTLHVLGD